MSRNRASTFRRNRMAGLAAAVMGMVCLAAASAEAAPGGGPVSRYTRLSDSSCTAFGTPPAEESVEIFGERCPGLGQHRVWLLYGEGMYLRVGFGRISNVSGMFNAERPQNWPIEWRGAMRGGRFVPYAVILRLRQPHQSTGGDLVVFQLIGDGGSCIIARIPPGPRQNSLARTNADRLLTGRVDCLEESAPID